MRQPFLFITARTSSRRLPRKALRRIGHQTVFEHVLDRALAVRGVAGTVLCTSTSPDDDALAHLAAAKGAAVYRGSLEDKLQRWRGAADRYGVEWFIAYDGDDLFCDPELMELTVAQMRAGPCDFLGLPEQLVVGGGAVGVTVDALRRLSAFAPPNVDHVWALISDPPFVVRSLDVADPIFQAQGIRLTLDYEEDLLFFQRVFQELGIERNTMPLRHILRFLERRPDIAAINWGRQQDYLDNQRRLTDADARRGASHVQDLE
jgi:spore coat polysaccharide biosynthesis protein SpsF